MARVTSKLQVTIPKAIAEQYGIQPGSEIEWLAAGEAIRVVPQAISPAADRARRLELFDRATARQHAFQEAKTIGDPPADRGWTREELYDRDRAR